MRKTPFLLLLLGMWSCAAAGWGALSSGLDMSFLDWEHGSQVSWGFKTSFGIRLVDHLYINASATIPAPTLIIIGNQLCWGGGVSYIPVDPEVGFALKTSLGVSRCHMWPEHIIVILADGDTAEPPPVHAFDGAEGLRLDGLVSLGYKWEDLALWLDLGVDRRDMEVERTVQGEKVRGDFTFTGVHAGISLEVFL